MSSNSQQKRGNAPRHHLSNTLEKGLSRAAEKFEQSIDNLNENTQRAKYNAGAAKSPTPPPRKSFTRDKQTIEIFKLIETDCYDGAGSILVLDLAEKFLFEQGQLREDQITTSVRTTNDLGVERDGLASHGRILDARRIQSRINKRYKFASGRLPHAKVYGWDKTTFLLKACFVSWAMNPQGVVPFTINLSARAVQGAKNARAGFASHLQSRLYNALKRRLGRQPPEFWFVVEEGTAGGYHLHGAINCGPDKATRKLVRDAFQSFCGLQSANAVHFGSSGQRLGWAQYCLKHSLRTTWTLGEKSLFACTASIRRDGKASYDPFLDDVRKLSRLKS